MERQLNQEAVVGRMINKQVVLLTLLASAAAYANQPFPHMPTAPEVAALSEPCQAKMGQNKQLHDTWRVRMGPDKFVHLHHYCHGLVAMNRLSRTLDKRIRRDLLQRATQEFDYVIRSWPPDFYLAIDAKRQQAMAHSMLKLV
jgi:hypothetical protein